MFARTTWGRALAVWLSVGLSQAAVPAVAPAAPGLANGHLVDQGQIARRLLERAKTRDERVKLFQEALATPEARQKARALGADPDRLRAAVPHLTDRELADLSARAAHVKDVAAGHGGGNGALVMLGILLVVAGIAVLVAVSDDYYHDDYYWDDCWCY
ncbi:MAG TPA: hypothetical protein VLL75_01510 [Vicinamibacteria bacterium]|nr:hypothetical protein [Vicinamibacteria bacterium]